MIADASSGASVIDFVVDDEHMTGIAFFEVNGGLIARITDFWPSPYQPPARMSTHVERY